MAGLAPVAGEHERAARDTAPHGPPEAAQQHQEEGQLKQQPRDGELQAALPPPPAPAADRPQLAADALAAQFKAQLEALTAISLGEVAADSTVLAACGGHIPAAAVSFRPSACITAARERIAQQTKAELLPSAVQVADLAEAAHTRRQWAAHGAASQQQQDRGAAGSRDDPPEASKLLC